jgi:hypothetical protein
MAGVTTWRSRDDVERSKRWAKRIATGLAVLGAFWLFGLFDNPDADTVLGLVILELFTLIPCIYALLRFRSLKKLTDAIDDLGEKELEEQAEELEANEEARWRIGRLVASLEPGPAQESGLDVLAAAETATETRRRLLRRRTELTHLQGTTKSAAGKSVGKAIADCNRKLDETQAALDELAAAVAQLVDTAEDARSETELTRLRDAVTRTETLSASLAELDRLTASPTARQ